MNINNASKGALDHFNADNLKNDMISLNFSSTTGYLYNESGAHNIKASRIVLIFDDENEASQPEGVPDFRCDDLILGTRQRYDSQKREVQDQDHNEAELSTKNQKQLSKTIQTINSND